MNDGPGVPYYRGRQYQPPLVPAVPCRNHFPTDRITPSRAFATALTATQHTHTHIRPHDPSMPAMGAHERAGASPLPIALNPYPRTE